VYKLAGHAAPKVKLAFWYIYIYINSVPGNKLNDDDDDIYIYFYSYSCVLSGKIYLQGKY
jgi:hypothetical protein